MKIVDTVSSQPGDLVLPMSAERTSTAAAPAPRVAGLLLSHIEELWVAADAETCALTIEEFSITLATIGARYNHGQPADTLRTVGTSGERRRETYV